MYALCGWMQAICLSSTIFFTINVEGEYRCQDGFSVFRNECILISRSSERMSWYEARATCHSLGVSVLTVHDEDKARYIKRRTHPEWKMHNVWTALHRTGSGMRFVWPDTGSTPEYVDWGLYQPDDGREECASMTRRGTWNDLPCHMRNAFVCEKQDAHAYSRPRLWIGLNDLNNSEEWSWLDQTYRERIWTNWDGHEPNDKEQPFRDCAYLTLGGKWLSYFCTSSLAVICERNHTDETLVCQEGWNSFGGSCYLFDRTYTVWEVARTKCQSYDADLVIMNNMEENNYIENRMSRDSWIGLIRLNGSNQFEWIDGETELSFNNLISVSWRHQWHCVRMYGSGEKLGKWANFGCLDRAMAICESSNKTARFHVQFRGKYYRFKRSRDDWFYSRVICQRMAPPSSDLVVISSQEEQDFLNAKMGNYTNGSGFWIGISSLHNRDVFASGDSREQVNWTNWDEAEPDYVHDEACVSMGSGGLQDYDCKENQRYGCEHPADGGPSYFDFRIGEHLFKLSEGTYTGAEADGYCARFGLNATLAGFNSVEELVQAGQEVWRRTLRRVNIWINHWAANVRRDGLCLYIGIHEGSMSSDQRACDSYQGNILCQKAVGPSTEDYDFRLASSIYIMKQGKMGRAEARETCQMTLEGGGWLLSIESQEEMDAIATELVIRHEGHGLEYWVFGNATDNFTLSMMSTPPRPDEDCLMLIHPSFPEHENTSKLILVPTVCEGSKSVICEQNLFPQDREVEPDANVTFEQRPAAVEEDSAGHGWKSPVIVWKVEHGADVTVEPRNAAVEEDSGGHDWKGPVVGLLVSFPIVLLVAFVVGVIYKRYKRGLPFLPVGFDASREAISLSPSRDF